MNFKPLVSQPLRQRYYLAFCCIVAGLCCASAVEAAPFAYVANNASSNVSVIDLATGVVIRTISLPSEPGAVAASPDGKFVYVAQVRAPIGISVISVETNAVIGTIAGLTAPKSIVFSPDGRFAYVANNQTNGTVAVIDTATRTVARTITVARNPQFLVVHPDGNYFYVTNVAGGDNSVLVVRVSDGVVVNTITVGRLAMGMAISRDGARLYVANNGSDTVSVIDTSNPIGNGVIKTLNVIAGPSWIAVKPDGSRIYIAQRAGTGQAFVVEVNPLDGSAGPQIPADRGPTNLVINAPGTHLYVSNEYSVPSKVTEINLATRAVKNIDVGREADGIALTAVAVPTAASAVSAASFGPGPLAGEAIGSLFGVELAGGTKVAATLPLPTTLAGTAVKVKDSMGTERLAPLFFVSPGQINFLVPRGTTVGVATLTVLNYSGFVSAGSKTMAVVAPSLFAANANGQGVAAAVALRVSAGGAQSYEPVARHDATQNRFVPVPVDMGPAGDQIFLLLYGTGIRNRSALASVAVMIGGVAAETLYVGPQGDFAGLDQLNVRLPRSLAGRGAVDIVLRVDGQTANTVQVNVR